MCVCGGGGGGGGDKAGTTSFGPVLTRELEVLAILKGCAGTAGCPNTTYTEITQIKVKLGLFYTRWTQFLKIICTTPSHLVHHSTLSETLLDCWDSDGWDPATLKDSDSEPLRGCRDQKDLPWGVR